MNPKSLNLIKSVVVVGALFGFVAIASAGTWTAPTSTPPAGNVDAPINIGTTAQTKNGAIAMTGLANYGTSALVGSVAIGDSSTPATSDMLSVAGVSQLFGELQLLSTIQIAGGSPAVGRVLTATDTSGDATWQTPATSTGLTAVAHDTTLTGAGTVASPLKVVGGASGTVTGTGTTNYLPKWTSSSALGNSEIVDSGSHIDIDTGLTVDSLGADSESLANGIQFGGDGSGEGIASTRVGGTVNGGGNQYGLNFYTDGDVHMQIYNNGRVIIPGTLQVGGLSLAGEIPLYIAGHSSSPSACGGAVDNFLNNVAVVTTSANTCGNSNTLVGYMVASTP